jgi:DNA invertase Pin-like site-specific DNA recombinase
LVAWLCAGIVGAVVCFDASRLARNGRDWHHLLELCGLVEARVIDQDGVYNPCHPNDRLLLGMKGSISEFELGVLRSRMLDAARSKARRGELRLSVPFGYVWHRDLGLGFDPDLRLQEVIRLIFGRFRQLGSARQVLLSMRADRIHFPRPSDEGRMTRIEWMPIRYRNVISVLKNPFYAGVYVYGKSEKRTEIIDGRARKSYGHGKPIGTWEVMIKDHHEGYISWTEYERNQKQLAINAYGLAGGPKSGRGGRALLSGMLTCGRCGRRLAVYYTGNPPSRPVYRCDKQNLMRVFRESSG